MILPIATERGSGRGDVSDHFADGGRSKYSVTPTPRPRLRPRSPLRLFQHSAIQHWLFSICFLAAALFFMFNATVLLIRLWHSSDQHASLYERLFHLKIADGPLMAFISLVHRESDGNQNFHSAHWRDSMYRHPHENITRVLQQHYWEDCGTRMSAKSVDALGLVKEIMKEDENGGLLIGTKMWNRLSIEEIGDPYRYFGKEISSQFEFPFTVLSYGKRLEQGKRLLSRMGAKDIDFVSYPSIEMAYDNCEYVSRYLFRDAAKMTRKEFMTEFQGKQAGYLLSTLNQWMIFERIANGTYPDKVFIVEDDVFLVPDFRRKFQVLQSQMASLPWEIIFVGTCFRLHSSDTVTPNLCRTNTTRCFNAVLMTKAAAQKILAAGATHDSFTAVDHLFNKYIVDLNITTYFVSPPLAFEQSKIEIQYPCLP